jgi:hypothetical protein
VRGAVVAVMLAGCGFSIQFGDNTPVDARTDATVDAAPDVGTDGKSCPAFYRVIGTGQYAVLDPTSFRNHMIACASHGTHLAVIDDAQELADLVAFGRTVQGVNANSRFYIGLVQAPDQLEPDDNWIDFHDQDANDALWATSGNNEPNDGADDNEGNHQEQVAALQLDREAIIDLAATENVRAYCECDDLAIGLKAQSYVDALP